MFQKTGFQELMSQVDGVIFHPLTVFFAWFALACVLVLKSPKSLALRKRLHSIIKTDRIAQLKALLGMPNFPTPLFMGFVLLWSALLLTLTLGLFTLLIEIVWNTLPSDETTDKADFRFLLTKTTALTAVLGAMVALPFTVIRLKLTTAQNKHNENVLYNDKLHQANNDLHAQRQVTKPFTATDDAGKEITKRETIWEDDIIRRNGAIDRLEALAVEDTTFAPRIARILCVYLKEMTAEHPAEEMPEGLEADGIWEWAQALEVKRSDMETAAQVLGRLHEKTKVTPNTLSIDLSGVNLQAMVLNVLNFEYAKLNHVKLDGAELNWAQLNWAKLNWAHLNGAHLNGAELYRAELNGAELNGAILNGAELNGAELNGAQLNGAKLNWAQLNWARLNEYTDLRAVEATGSALRSVYLEKVKNLENLENLLAGAFGDASVTLPEGMQHLVKDKWPDTELSGQEYEDEWALFKQDPDAYIPPQLRNDD